MGVFGMAQKYDSINESRRLQVEAAEIRLKSIQSQLALAFTLCAMTETELGYGRIAQAHALVEKVRHIARTVRFHLDEPNHVSSDQVDEPRRHVERLESQIRVLETLLN
jgi:hypothetical protein